MKKRLLKRIALAVLTFVLAFAVSACGGKEDISIEDAVDSAVKEAFETYAVQAAVIIEADGKQYNVEDSQGKTLQQLLDMTGISLGENDILTISPHQSFTGPITVIVQRGVVSAETAPVIPQPDNTDADDPSENEPEDEEKNDAESDPEANLETNGERTVVSIEVYEDCDGSGHGIKIITYSDGTQEEVLF